MCFTWWQCTNGNIQLKFYGFTLKVLRVSFINLFEQTNITVFVHFKTYSFMTKIFIMKVQGIIMVFLILLFTRFRLTLRSPMYIPFVFFHARDFSGWFYHLCELKVDSEIAS